MGPAMPGGGARTGRRNTATTVLVGIEMTLTHLCRVQSPALFEATGTAGQVVVGPCVACRGTRAGAAALTVDQWIEMTLAHLRRIESTALDPAERPAARQIVVDPLKARR